MSDFQKWHELMHYMIDTFGVRSALDNVDDNQEELEEEGIWFECPNCGEPLLMSDWSFSEVMHRCPVCEEEYEED